MTGSLSLDRGIARPAARRQAPVRRRWLPVALLLAPSLLFLALFTYWPVLRVLGESLLVGRFAGQSTLGLGNYQRLFADPHFARAALNNRHGISVAIQPVGECWPGNAGSGDQNRVFFLHLRRPIYFSTTEGEATCDTSSIIGRESRGAGSL